MQHPHVSSLGPGARVPFRTSNQQTNSGGGPGFLRFTRLYEDPAILRDKNVLLVEDEVLVAMDIEFALADIGAKVLGPANSLASAHDAVATNTQIDIAILDVNLNGNEIYPVAEILAARGVPIAFHTGHGVSIDLEAQFPGSLVCLKPMIAMDLLGAVASLISKTDGS
ncbi:MAG: hypothetical protein AB8B71_13215 [Paracoccaceae bacterium]